MNTQSSGLMQAEMEKRIIHYDELVPCRDAFIDAKTPGSDKKENFCLIGPGVAERPGQHVHIRIPHGFNIGGARQPHGCLNSQHSHVSAEVFLVHRGQWAFRWGHDAKDGEVILGPGDVISIPVQVFRGFENVGEDDGFLFAILGGDDPGFVTWAPYVFENAKDHGLVLLNNDRLIDTSKGEVIPEGVKPVKATSMKDVEKFRRMNMEEMLACVLFEKDMKPLSDTLTTKPGNGVIEVPVIGAPNTSENVPSGKMGWPHGFHFRRLDFQAGATVQSHVCAQEKVVFIQSGQLEYCWNERALTLYEGDTLTVPIGLNHEFRNTSKESSTAFVVHGGNQPRITAVGS